MDFQVVVDVYTFVMAHKAEIIVYAFAASGVAAQLAAITPWTWDDSFAMGFGKVLNVLAGAWGFAKPEPVQPVPAVILTPAPVRIVPPAEPEVERPVSEWHD